MARDGKGLAAVGKGGLSTVYRHEVRPASGRIGRSVLALAATLAIVFSLFTIVSSVEATHDGGFDHHPLPIDTSTFVHAQDECVGEALGEGEVLLHWVATQQNVTSAITLTLHVEGWTDPLVQSSEKWNTPAEINGNVTHHFYVRVAGDVVITDLDLSTNEGNLRLSHVCRGGAVAGEEGGSITIRKNSVPDSSTYDFSFTTTGEGLSSFMLDDDADPTLPREVTFTDLAPGTYTVTEASLPNWRLTQLDCSAGGTGDIPTLTATIELTAGAHVTCTFVNVKHPLPEPEPETGSITIRKNSVPDSSTYDFSFTTTGEGLSSFTLDDDADPTLPREVTFTDLAPGTYTVTEAAQPEWRLTQLDCSAGGTGDIPTLTATIELTAGAHVTCTFVNVKHPLPDEVELGSVMVAKVDDEGALLGGAQFEIDGVPISDSDIDGFVCMDGLEIGTDVTVEETVAPAGYTGADEVFHVDVADASSCETRLAGAVSADADLVIVNVPEDVGQPGGGEQPSGGGQAPREDVLGGNPLPDTSMSREANAAPAALLALAFIVALTGMSWTTAQARRRR